MEVRGLFRGTTVTVFLLIFSLIAFACGGGGGGLTPTPLDGDGDDYPQHYSTGLDGDWFVNASNVQFVDPQGVWNAADRAELREDIEETMLLEIRNGREVVGDLPFGIHLSENRLSRLSDTQYQLVQRGSGTVTEGGATVTVNVEVIYSGSVNTSRTVWTASGIWRYTASGPGGTVAASITFDFIATKD